MNRTTVTKAFLDQYSTHYLVPYIEAGHELQVQVAQDDGEKHVEGRNKYYTDQITRWYDFRVPKKAATDPEDNDYPIKFNFEAHVEAIGYTGWNWIKKESNWVGFDFDAIVGHVKQGLAPDELDVIQKALSSIPWVTIIRSTSGNGLHVYAHVPGVPTETHTEHAALARSILATMSALCGTNFEDTVDVCGQILWVWHRRAGNNVTSYQLLKQGRLMYPKEVPLNWKDHLTVIRGTSSRNKLSMIPEGKQDKFAQLMGQYPRIPLDDSHKALVEYLKSTDCVWWWDQDMYMLVTHTCHLRDAHRALKMKGVFDTSSSHTTPHNCFAFPLRKGAWVVRRYGGRMQEHDFWEQDAAGWTKIYLNKEQSFEACVRVNNGLEHHRGGYHFSSAEDMMRCVQGLNHDIDLPPRMAHRDARLSVSKTNKLVVEIARTPDDSTGDMRGWIAEKKTFVKVLGPVEQQTDILEDDNTINYDDVIRHLISTADSDAGWVVNLDDTWRIEPLTHIRTFLYSKGLDGKATTDVLGQCIAKAWKLVNKPFKPEYCGNREWNRDGARLRYTLDTTIENPQFPTWRKIIDHCGQGLDRVVQREDWCQMLGLQNGGDYLLLWVANMFQHPEKSLPYLFFYGDQNSGKSTFHESLELLFTKGYTAADRALTSASGFNGELMGAVLCYVEEINLSDKNQLAYNRIKDWVTGKHIMIHEKGNQPYLAENTTHWVQCANSDGYCPIFPGDTRIVVTECQPIPASELMPRDELSMRLKQEAKDFLSYVFNMKLPRLQTRLAIPVLETAEKAMMQSKNTGLLDEFIREECVEIVGNLLPFTDFYERYKKFLDVSIRGEWTKIRVSKNLPSKFPSGSSTRHNNQKYIGNLAFKDSEIVDCDGRPVICVEGTLRKEL